MDKPEVTILALIYKSPLYLDFVLEGIYAPKNDTPFKMMIVACDPEPQIESDPRVTYIYRNANPNGTAGHRTYHAWNYGASLCDTPYIIMVGSDMYGYDHWIDELVLAIKEDSFNLPTSLLIENGRIRSAFPEYVRDFGTPTRGFDREGFRARAAEIQKPGHYSRGRLNQPVLFLTEDFMALGGFPTVDGGDVDLFKRMVFAGYQWKTCEGSVVYHTMRGEAAND
jgi:hypothetical protein